MTKPRATAHFLKVFAQWFSVLAAAFASLPDAGRAGDLYVPGGFSTVQAAINAANTGDVIHLAAGRYNEMLTINKSLTLAGSSASNCVIYFLTNGTPNISITGPGSCTLSNLEIEGGQYMGSEWYSGMSDLGIVASNVTLTLDTIVMNQFKNFFVTVVDGGIYATNVSLWTRNVLAGCDVGFQLKGCNGVISGLHQDAGHLDHTININDAPAHHSDLTIDHCVIRASSLDYGNCVRTYTDSIVRITGCVFYRNPAEATPAYPAFNHNGVGVNGYSNTVLISGNTFTNLPWGMYCVGSLGGNQVTVESNQFINSTIGGVVWDAMNYRGIDLGGGPFGSHGANVFTEPVAPPASYCDDILVTNANGVSAANIFALNNVWSSPANPDGVIHDKLEQPILGRVITSALAIKSAGRSAAGKPVLTWNERGAGEQYTIQYSTDLNSGVWSNAPGAWPMTNPGLADMHWTNSALNSASLFYRIISIVP